MSEPRRRDSHPGRPRGDHLEPSRTAEELAESPDVRGEKPVTGLFRSERPAEAKCSGVVPDRSCAEVDLLSGRHLFGRLASSRAEHPDRFLLGPLLKRPDRCPLFDLVEELEEMRNVGTPEPLTPDRASLDSDPAGENEGGLFPALGAREPEERCPNGAALKKGKKPGGSGCGSGTTVHPNRSTTNKPRRAHDESCARVHAFKMPSSEELELLFSQLTDDRASFEPITERMLPELRARVLALVEEETAVERIVDVALSNAWVTRGRRVTQDFICECADVFAKRYAGERRARRPLPDPAPRTEPHEEWMDRARLREVYQRDALYAERYRKDLDDTP